MINILSRQIHANNKKKGFYDDEKNIGEMLALIHSEVSEALEADRKGIFSQAKAYDLLVIRDDQNFIKAFQNDIKDSFEDEIADAIIRLLDLSAYLDIDIESHIKAKMRFNTTRSYKHGKRY